MFILKDVILIGIWCMSIGYIVGALIFSAEGAGDNDKI